MIQSISEVGRVSIYDHIQSISEVGRVSIYDTVYIRGRQSQYI